MAKKVAVEKAEVGVEKDKKFSSYKGRLHFNEGGLSIDVPIRWKNMDTTKELDYPVIYRDAEGREVKSFSVADGKIIAPKTGDAANFLSESVENKVSQNKKYFTADGIEVLEGVRTFQVIDGKEEEVQKLDKSEDLIVFASKPVEEYEEWLEESLYSIWGEKPTDVFGLGKFAKHLADKKIMAIVKVSIGKSFKMNYGMIKPQFNADGSFTLSMKITRQRVKFFEQSKMAYITKAPKIEEEANMPKSKMESL